MRDVGAWPAPARASEDELVVQLRGPAVHPPRRQERDVPLADDRLEPGGAPLDLVLEAVRRSLRVGIGRHVRVRPGRLLALGRARRVAGRVLAEEHERPLRLAALRELGGVLRQRVERLGQVDDGRAARGLSGPRHDGVERPVDLDDRGVRLDGRRGRTAEQPVELPDADGGEHVARDARRRHRSRHRPRVRCARGHARPACR